MNQQDNTGEFKDRFKLGVELGRGSCGTVYKGTLVKPLRENPTVREIAVKIIHPELLGSRTVLGAS